MEENKEQPTETVKVYQNSFTSENIGKIAEALSKFQGECPEITLDADVEVTMNNGGKYKFKYATLANINKIIKPFMAKHGLSITQVTSTKAGEITTLLMHSSGEWIRSEIKMPAYTKPQDMGSAITYGRRYSMCAILGLSANTDDDGNIAHGNSLKENSSAGKKQPPVKPTPPPPRTKKPIITPDSEKWEKALEAVKKGMSKEDMRKSYEISDEHYDKLKKDSII